MARVAGSLDQLRREVRAKWAGTTVWWIGDPAHASRCSRHNENDAGVVCAIDILPDGGCPIHALADQLVRNPHPELDYVISNWRVASRRTGWRWARYTGSNGHTSHIHVAVGRGSECEPRPPYDSRQSWGITATAQPAPTPPRPTPSGPLEYDMDFLDLRNAHVTPVKGRHVDNLQSLIIATWAVIPGVHPHISGMVNGYGLPDGVAGKSTQAALRAVQDGLRYLKVYSGKTDLMVGDGTWKALIEF